MTVNYSLSKLLTKKVYHSYFSLKATRFWFIKIKSSLKPIFDSICRKSKGLYLVGDVNINALDYENHVKVKLFVNFGLQNSSILVINKPARVTRTNATVIDHILLTIS